ncbi:MAG TPA: hypothetical protein PKC91_09970 [Ignavibacteria bacterium]|nr:hypothetical protein [Ignavibacteria bacterium]
MRENNGTLIKQIELKNSGLFYVLKIILKIFVICISMISLSMAAKSWTIGESDDLNYLYLLYNY